MRRPRFNWAIAGRSLELGPRTLIMGVINVTPDSFSDGGLFEKTGAAVAQGLRLAAEGADVLDLGGESTRPGAQPVSAQDELARVLPVIKGLKEAGCQTPISIDTMKAEVAKEALAAGAAIINDVSALRFDPGMAALAAKSGAGLILMHMKGEPRTMQKNPTYGNVVGEVASFLQARAQAAQGAGVKNQSIMLDPGIGFGKALEHNLDLIRGLPRLAGLGYPLLLGASRKAFIGLLTGKPPLERTHGTVGAHVLGAWLGAHMVRVHEVDPVGQALMVSDAVMAQGA